MELVEWLTRAGRPPTKTVPPSRTGRPLIQNVDVRVCRTPGTSGTSGHQRDGLSAWTGGDLGPDTPTPFDPSSAAGRPAPLRSSGFFGLLARKGGVHADV